MRLVALHDSSATNIVETAGGILVSGGEQQTARIDGHRGDRTALQGQIGGGSHHLNGLVGTQVPEAARLVGRARHEHVLGARPRVERVDVLRVARVRAQRLQTRAIGHVDFAIASAARHQQ